MGFMSWCRRRLTEIVAGIRHVLRGWLWARPVVATHAAGTASDLLRGRAQLLAENVLLRQQLLVLRRRVLPLDTVGNSGAADRGGGRPAAAICR